MTKIRTTMGYFSEFVGATTPGARMRVISRARQPYEPAHDFYKSLREAIEGGHVRGRLRRALDGAVMDAHPKRAPSYRLCAGRYMEFIESTGARWVGDPPARIWNEGELSVQVNPEQLLRVDGEATIIKLFFKDRLPRLTRQAMMQLMRWRYGDGQAVGVLEVRASRLWRPGAPIPSAAAFLGSEADAFVGAWRRMEPPPTTGDQAHRD